MRREKWYEVTEDLYDDWSNYPCIDMVGDDRDFDSIIESKGYVNNYTYHSTYGNMYPAKAYFQNSNDIRFNTLESEYIDVQVNDELAGALPHKYDKFRAIIEYGKDHDYTANTMVRLMFKAIDDDRKVGDRFKFDLSYYKMSIAYVCASALSLGMDKFDIAKSIYVEKGSADYDEYARIIKSLCDTTGKVYPKRNWGFVSPSVYIPCYKLFKVNDDVSQFDLRYQTIIFDLKLYVDITGDKNDVTMSIYPYIYNKHSGSGFYIENVLYRKSYKCTDIRESNAIAKDKMNDVKCKVHAEKRNGMVYFYFDNELMFVEMGIKSYSYDGTTLIDPKGVAINSSDVPKTHIYSFSKWMRMDNK